MCAVVSNAVVDAGDAHARLLILHDGIVGITEADSTSKLVALRASRQCGRRLEVCPKLAPTCAQVLNQVCQAGTKLVQVAPTPKLAQVEPKLAHGGHNLGARWPQVCRSKLQGRVKLPLECMVVEMAKTHNISRCSKLFGGSWLQVDTNFAHAHAKFAPRDLGRSLPKDGPRWGKSSPGCLRTVFKMGKDRVDPRTTRRYRRSGRCRGGVSTSRMFGDRWYS